MPNNKTKVETKDLKLIMERIFGAPPQLMFEIWSSCKHLKHWWGPKEWPIDECEMDFREGGKWRYCLRGPNISDESWGLAIYKEINNPDSIVYKDHFTDAEGNVAPDMPNMIINVEFIELVDKTSQRITVNFDTNEERDKIVEMGMAEGMDSSLDRLEDYLAQTISTNDH